ncbi:MAG: NAD-dependent epimerase/dehydratase family protein [Acidiferrobacterales bacterium]|nr:NAD-dependent epimerase/dehydratase family protein [Acidiferrobacterales bacterium]
MTTLVTGASGFIGSAVVRALLQAGHEVRVFLRPQSDRRNIEGLPVSVATGDLTNRVSLERAVDGCEVLFHVAADYRIWVPNPDDIYRINVTGTRDLMLAAGAAGVKRVVYTSSVATLGSNGDHSPSNEDTPVTLAEMIGHYKRSKFLAEQEVHKLVQEAGLPAVIVNPSAPIGPRDIKPTPTGRLVLDAARGRMPAYVDTGLNVVHVDDVGTGHVLAFERGRVGQRYILGARNMTLIEILQTIAQISGRRPPRLCLPPNVILPFAYLSEIWARLMRGEPRISVDGVRLARKYMFFSIDKARRELGFDPRPAEQALRDAIGWFREHGYC